MNESPSKLHAYLYYLSFVLIWATIAIVASMYLLDYEDKWDSRTNETMWAWSTMETSHKIGYLTFLVMQFPFGLLFGLFTGNYNNGLFAFIINPLFIAWVLQMIFRNSQKTHIKRTLKVNYAIWTTMLLTIVGYLMLE
jgi:hypothetical protein